MTDLVEWLRAALDETERLAQAVTSPDWTDVYGAASATARPFVATRGPDFVLRTVQAHREILDRHSPRKVMNNDGVRVIATECGYCTEGSDDLGSIHADWPCPDVRSLARIYRESFPGFDPSWIGES